MTTQSRLNQLHEVARERILTPDEREELRSLLRAEAKRPRLQHTPGPWRFAWYTTGTEPPIDWREEPTLSIYAEAGPLVGDVAYVNGCLGHDRRDANARLIAAAPDLLAALTRVSTFLEANYETRDMPDILGPVREAIEKAGVSPPADVSNTRAKESRWACPECGSEHVQVALPTWYRESVGLDLELVETDSGAEVLFWYCEACEAEGQGEPVDLCCQPGLPADQWTEAERKQLEAATIGLPPFAFNRIRRKP